MDEKEVARLQMLIAGAAATAHALISAGAPADESTIERAFAFADKFVAEAERRGLPKV